MKIFILFTLILTFNVQLIAQEILYSSHQTISDTTLRTEIGLFDLTTCLVKELYVDTTRDINISDDYHEWLDVAICPDSLIYALGHDGIYRIDTALNVHTKILEGPGLPYRRWKKGLTCSKDTTLIFGELDVFTFKPYSGELVNKGQLPTALSLWADIFWINDRLMGSQSGQIIEIDLEDLASSQVVYELQSTGNLSLIPVSVYCDSTAIFAFDIHGDIFLVDSISGSVTLYCSLPTSFGETYQGSEPTFMYMPPPPCTIHIDLDSLDELALGIDVRDTVACFLPGEFLFAELNLSSGRPWDSLYAWIETGPPGIALNAIDSGDATVTGSNTGQLRFYTNNQSNLSDFRNSLYNIQLTGGVPVGYSDVIIGFRLFADHLRSDTAYAFITIAGRTNFAGLDGNLLALCPDASPFDLGTLISVDASPGGDWIPHTNINEFFNPSTDPGGTYQYIVQDPNCGPDSATFEIALLDIEQVDLGPDLKLCTGDTIALHISGQSGSSIQWSTGEIGATVHLNAPQQLFVDIVDSNGCHSSDTIHITTDLACLSEKLYIPNVFSPNADGINDLFSILPGAAIIQMQCTIFDRWGNALFHQQGPEIHWDGKAKGDKPVNPGVYAYSVIVQVGTESFLRQGDITVIR